MRKIYYVGYYSGLENPNNFHEFPSSNSKMDYIISVIRRLNFNLTIFSLGFPKKKSRLFKKKKTISLDQKTHFVFVSTISLSLSFLSFISKIWLYFQVIYLLLFRIKKGDVVLVYHSFLLNKVVNFCRMFSKFKLIYEVEEIYQAAWQNSNEKIEGEIKSLKNADGYILVNDIMLEKFQLDNKPSVVCYGSYLQNKSNERIVDNKVINLVYAGFIGGLGSDVMLALDTIDLLPDGYFLNVLGYGDMVNIKTMNSKIEKINDLKGKEKVKYFGCLTGDEYDLFLSKCQIGLSTRVLIDEYSDYTFPSKVLVYLCNNLIPVSSKINCISKSKIKESVVFYESNNPESVANSIINIDIDNYLEKNNNLVKLLDKEFLKDFNNLVTNVCDSTKDRLLR